MRPNTPHVVFTAEHSVCMGGHFYATSTLRDTCYGMMHSFVAGSLITNAHHTQHAFMLLSRLLAFFELHFLNTSASTNDDMDNDVGKQFISTVLSLLIRAIHVNTQICMIQHIIYPIFRHLMEFLTLPLCAV
jgi:hypothetical protein